jgi:hypothetical protein
MINEFKMRLPCPPAYPAMQKKLQQAAREAITARGQMLKELDKRLEKIYSSTLSISRSR